MSDDQLPVRPLGIEESEQHHPPRLTLVLVLLAVGGLIGWGVASLGGDSIATATTTTLDPDTSPLGDSSVEQQAGPVVSWVEAGSIPEFPAAMDYAGSTDPVEFGGSIYLVVRYSDGEDIRNELWESSDGIEWASNAIELDADVSVVEIEAVTQGLLITGVGDGVFGLWRSVPGRSLGGSSWVRVPVAIPDGLEPEFYATAANQRNEVITTVIGNLAIWRDVIAPHVPENLNLDDARLRFENGILYLGEGSTLEPFLEPPDVLTVDGNVWIRLVTPNGKETLQTIELPAGAYPIETAPDLSFIPVALSWRSEDGIDFEPVTGRNALPDGYFLPEAWGGGFITAVYELPSAFAPNEDVSLWRTESGIAWQPTDDQPPRECARFFFAVSRSRLVLTGEDGTRCVWDNDEWSIVSDSSLVSFVVGGPAGFLGYPAVSEVDTASFSRDGRSWSEVGIPASGADPSLSILNDRLLALLVTHPRPNVPGRIEIWLGEIE